MSLALLVLLLTLPALPGEPEREEVVRRLEALRAEIAALRSEDRALEEEGRAEREALEQADREVAAAAAREREAAEALAAVEARLAALAAERDQLDAALATERRRLSAVLRLAFLLGRDAGLAALLGPERAAARGRALAMLAHLKARRAHLIGELRRLLERQRRTELRALRAAERRGARLEALRRERERLAAARAAQAERARELAERRRRAADRLAALDREATELESLLARLSDVFAGHPPFMRGSPLPARRGALAWPVEGQVLRGFGAEEAPGRRLRGLLIAAPAGSPVRAIAHGRAAFADWFPGLGMLVVLDHGEGFLSLYGHLESLLVELGEWVDEGQPVGTVGASGGAPQPALHFELRRRGRAVDPVLWLARRR